MMSEARLLGLDDLRSVKAETTLFLETKQTLRPAFFFGIEERPLPLRMKDGSNRFTISLMTAAKIAKHWEWRLYNKTWRLWSEKPTRDQQLTAWNQ